MTFCTSPVCLDLEGKPLTWQQWLENYKYDPKLTIVRVPVLLTLSRFV